MKRMSVEEFRAIVGTPPPETKKPRRKGRLLQDQYDDAAKRKKPRKPTRDVNEWLVCPKCHALIGGDGLTFEEAHEQATAALKAHECRGDDDA